MTDNEKKVASCWTFLTNHAHVLLCLAKTSSMRIRDLAIEVGITERAVQRILSELTEYGYIERTRDGRTNSYTLDKSKHLKHPIESHRRISDLITLIYDNPETLDALNDPSCAASEPAGISKKRK